NKKIAIIKGEGGRPWLIDTLLEKGAWVTPIIAYRRQLPTATSQPCVQRLTEQCIDVVVATSNETLKNMLLWVGKMNQSMVLSLPVVVASERVAQFAKTLGFKTILQATNASDDSVLDVLLQWKG